MTDKPVKEQDSARGSSRGTGVPPRMGSGAPRLRGERSEYFCEAKVLAPLGAEALKSLGPLELAHVGDGVYELLVRTHLARQGGGKVGDKHRSAVAYVSAPAQAAAAERLQSILTEEERHGPGGPVRLAVAQRAAGAGGGAVRHDPGRRGPCLLTPYL